MAKHEKKIPCVDDAVARCAASDTFRYKNAPRVARVFMSVALGIEVEYVAKRNMFETDSPLKRPNNYFNLYFCCFIHFLVSVFHNVDYFCLVLILNVKVMSKSKKIHFLDSVVEQLAIYCPQMSFEVMYFVACQFALESNFGESRLAKLKNNFCGMKVPQYRLTLCKNSSDDFSKNSLGDFAKYDSFVDCIIDYVLWLSWNHFNSQQVFNLNSFTRLLIACNYCPDIDYIDRVYTLYNSFKSN